MNLQAYQVDQDRAISVNVIQIQSGKIMVEPSPPIITKISDEVEDTLDSI